MRALCIPIFLSALVATLIAFSKSQMLPSQINIRHPPVHPLRLKALVGVGRTNGTSQHKTVKEIFVSDTERATPFPRYCPFWNHWLAMSRIGTALNTRNMVMDEKRGVISSSTFIYYNFYLPGDNLKV